MRIRTYGVVRGVMLKHPPTRFWGAPAPRTVQEHRSLPECRCAALRFPLLSADQTSEKLLRKIGVNLRAVRLVQNIGKRIFGELDCAAGIPA